MMKLLEFSCEERSDEERNGLMGGWLSVGRRYHGEKSSTVMKKFWEGNERW